MGGLHPAQRVGFHASRFNETRRPGDSVVKLGAVEPVAVFPEGLEEAALDVDSHEWVVEGCRCDLRQLHRAVPPLGRRRRRTHAAAPAARLLDHARRMDRDRDPCDLGSVGVDVGVAPPGADDVVTQFGHHGRPLGAIGRGEGGVGGRHAAQGKMLETFRVVRGPHQRVHHRAPLGVADRPVMGEADRLQPLDQPPRDVADGRRLHRRVRQPLAGAHLVVEELAGVEAVGEGRGTEPVGLDRPRPGAVARDPLGDSLRSHSDLTHRAQNLSEIDVRAFGTALHHRGEAVPARIVGESGEHAAPRRIQHALGRVQQQGLAVILVGDGGVDGGRMCPHPVHGSGDALPRCGGHDGVPCADRERVQPQEGGGDTLQVREEVGRAQGRYVGGDRVDDAALPGAQLVLLHLPAEQLAAADVAAPVGLALAEREVRRQYVREQLRARPEPLRLEDAGPRQRAVGVVPAHRELGDRVALEEDVLGRQQEGSQQRILHGRHGDAAGLARQYVVFDRQQLLRVGTRLLGLRHVEIHLVAVEVRVIGGTGDHGQPYGARPVAHDAGFVHHERLLVEGGLPVQQDEVAIFDVAVHDGPGGERQGPAARHIRHDRERHRALRVGVLDVEGPGPPVGAPHHALTQALAVEVGDPLRVGLRLGDEEGNARFGEVERRVAPDDAPRAEPDPLAHEVAPDPASLAPQAEAEAPAGAAAGGRAPPVSYTSPRILIKVQLQLQLQGGLGARGGGGVAVPERRGELAVGLHDVL